MLPRSLTTWKERCKALTCRTNQALNELKISINEKSTNLFRFCFSYCVFSRNVRSGRPLNFVHPRAHFARHVRPITRNVKADVIRLFGGTEFRTVASKTIWGLESETLFVGDKAINRGNVARLRGLWLVAACRKWIINVGLESRDVENLLDGLYQGLRRANRMLLENKTDSSRFQTRRNGETRSWNTRRPNNTVETTMHPKCCSP